jgi:diphthamide synthase (EF-2-diphthine--ammonia ligase)
MAFIYPRFSMQSKRTLLSWSTSKDSVYSLHLLQSIPTVNLVYLFTTINLAFERVAVYAVRLKLLKEQARQIGLPLDIIEIPHLRPK